MTNKEKLKQIVSNPILWIETFVNIVDKKGRIVPFKFNPQQKYIMKHRGKRKLEKCWFYKKDCRFTAAVL